MSHPNRSRSAEDFKVPPGWEKGEPLTVNRVHEGQYQLYRSGSYLLLPGAPVTTEVPCLEFESRAQMVKFQRWWDNPSYFYYEKGQPHFWLTKSEFLEVLQELFHLNLREILGNRQGVDKVPAFSMAIQVRTEAEQKALSEAHGRFLDEVRVILRVPGPDQQVDGD